MRPCESGTPENAVTCCHAVTCCQTFSGYSRRNVLLLLLIDKSFIIIIIKNDKNVKKQSDDMLKKQIKHDKAPFKKQRNMTAPKGSPTMQTQVSQDLFDDFMKFARRYNIEHHVPKTKRGEINKSNPLKHIVKEFLDSHALERQCFKDYYVIMLLSNPFDYHKRHAEVIGFVEHPEKFTIDFPFNVDMLYQRQYGDTGLAYCLEPFDKQIFDMLNLKSLDRQALFNIDPSINGDFDEVREHLRGLYPDIDFDNAHLVMFNLNNYFDILRDGVYTSENVKDKHDGAIVLLEPYFKLERIFIKISWSYHAGVLDFEFDELDEGHFNETLSMRLPPAVCQAYHFGIFSGLMDSERAKLEQSLENLNFEIYMSEQQLDRMKKQKADVSKRIDELYNQ